MYSFEMSKLSQFYQHLKTNQKEERKIKDLLELWFQIDG